MNYSYKDVIEQDIITWLNQNPDILDEDYLDISDELRDQLYAAYQGFNEVFDFDPKYFEEYIFSDPDTVYEALTYDDSESWNEIVNMLLHKDYKEIDLMTRRYLIDEVLPGILEDVYGV